MLEGGRDSTAVANYPVYILGSAEHAQRGGVTSLFWEQSGVAEGTSQDPGSLSLFCAGTINHAESSSPLNSIVGDTGVGGVTQRVPPTRGREKPGSKGGRQTGSALTVPCCAEASRNPPFFPLEMKDKLREEREQLWIAGDTALMEMRGKNSGEKR